MTDQLVFPILHDDKIMREKVAHKPEIRFMDQENGTVVCSYIVSCDGTFDEMYSREARGIVFDKNGKVISRPLNKFFNLNQNSDVQFEKIDWSTIARVMDKRDGCCDAETVLITPDGPKTIKEICDTKYHGLVLGWNHISKQTELTPVLGHSVKPNNADWYELEFENGKKIKLTGNHLVWSINRNQYVRADELTIEDEVQELN